MTPDQNFTTEPCFVISVAARMVGLHAQTLRYYERVGLVMPSRSGGRQRLYSMADVDRLRRIKTFVDEMGVNLAGAEVALRLTEQIIDLQNQVEALTNEVNRLRAAGNTAGDGRTRNNSTRRDNATRR
ncbi:MAG: MerR family transcriptional regulator [Chloroflexota bacterium]|nr:MerR family transcriptional regulator [Chloroflexota bacterium]MDE2960041.1 MerR family transcriptional regulator [Chloroflexota bacterium]